ncbi:T9SS type A sorting domain-containing protein [Flavobacterium sp.]|uniref:T9SS type A sorting domain-containing protein n=1 Tax=Flavobacterium sp. TaxID=239 RepID=UPI0032677214
MKKTLLFMLLSLTAILSAQNNATDFDWAFNTGGGYNTTRRIQYNSQGDLLCMVNIGNKTTFGSVAMQGQGFSSFPGSVTFIGKRTQAGVKTVLVKVLSSNSYIANFEDFTIDANDNIIVSGTVFNATTPYDFGNGVTLLGKGYFVAKYNPNGECQWAKLFTFNVATISSTNKPIALGILPNNDIYFAARSSNGNQPFWLLRLDSNGTEVWHKEWILPSSNYITISTSKNNCFFDTTGKAYFYITNLYSDAITVDGVALTIPAGAHPTGSHILTIDGNGANDLFTSHRGAIGDLAVEKATGNVLVKWSQYNANPAPFNTVNHTNNVYQGIVALDANRNYLNSTPNPVLNQADIDAIFPLGNLKFVGMKVLAPGASIVAGSQSFTASKYTPTWKFFDSFVMSKFVAHPELNETSATVYPFIAAYNNKLAVSGSYSLTNNATVSVNGTTLTACENDLTFAATFPAFASLAGDLFIAQLTNGASLGIEKKDITESVSIYPNPANSDFHIQTDENLIDSKVTIYNLLGQKIKSFTLNAATTNQTLNKGIYFIQIQKNGSKTTKKLIVN